MNYIKLFMVDYYLNFFKISVFPKLRSCYVEVIFGHIWNQAYLL